MYEDWRYGVTKLSWISELNCLPSNAQMSGIREKYQVLRKFFRLVGNFDFCH